MHWLFEACCGLVRDLDGVVLVVSCYCAWGIVGRWGPVMHGGFYRCCRGDVVRSRVCMSDFCCVIIIHIVSIVVFSPVVAYWCYLHVAGWIFGSV